MNPGDEDSLRLVVNAEGRRVDAAILQGREWIDSETVEGNSVENLAPALRAILARTKIKPAGLHTWIYSGGPGSLLGLRSLAMLLATWEISNPANSISKYRYSGLVWTAREIQRTITDQPFLLISPWRTNAWNVLRVENHPATESALEVVEGDPAADTDLPVYVLGERLRAIPPAGSQTLSLPKIETLAHHIDEPGFLVETNTIEPLQSGTTEYKKWTPTLPAQ